jgi:cytidylate kinase
MTNSIVIAVDGTAASGKGTLARRLAQHFGFAHLDSGSLYRLVALNLLRNGHNPGDEPNAATAARQIDPADALSHDLRASKLAEAASIVASFPRVRAALLDYQRAFAARPAGGAAGVVIDGRDIGTVVCASADAKLFIDARSDVRAHRRWLELQQVGQVTSEDAILEEIRARDERDRSRETAPLALAPDAILLDTSELNIDATFAAALALVQPRIEEALKTRRRG